MRSTFCILLFFFFCSTSFSQIKPISLYGEVGGNAGFDSFNLDRLFYAKNKTRFSYRVGVGYSPGAAAAGKVPIVIIFPTLINYIYGNKKHFAELGVGQGLALSTQMAIFSRLTLNLGYRFQQDNGGWFFKIAYTPLISFMYDLQWQHWAGIGIGYTLKSKGKCPCESAK